MSESRKTRSEPVPAADAVEARPLHSPEPYLFEVAWEVCQQLGGIYTVIRSKAPYMMEQWGRRYCLLGPYNAEVSPAEFEEAAPVGHIAHAIKELHKQGLEAHYGTWLITGRPQVVLLNPYSAYGRLAEIKYLLWEHHGISMPADDDLLNQVVAMGYLVEQFLRAMVAQKTFRHPIIAHFHEWMAASALPELRRAAVPVSTVFTTHATQLGRVLAMNDPWFYDHVPFVDWAADARRFRIEPQVKLERAAAHGSHVFSTVSEITAFECEHLLGRKPDVLLPNGLNIERFVAMHEFQNLHRMYKDKINQFVMAHFFPSYAFDLDRTLYFFIAGRYEYRNKGFDLALESLRRLNLAMKQANSDRTIVFFLITRRPYRSINSEELRSRAVMEELRNNCQAIKDQFGERLFLATAMGATPPADELVDDYLRLRLRRLTHAWRTRRLPTIVTHDLVDDANDEVLNQLRAANLINLPEDPVKVVYHPDFITSADPLFGMDYDQFVRGCHLGVFPSYYEPWGYTPLECVARGVPAVTSDLSGFGTYLLENMPDHEDRGLFVVGRRRASFQTAADELANMLLKILRLDRRERITQRNQVENISEHFDWHNLGRHYDAAYRMASERR
jgi:glycogen(starch) synthase